jgi:hypothetical protein
MQQTAAELIVVPDAEYAHLEEDVLNRLSLKLSKWLAEHDRAGSRDTTHTPAAVEPLLVLATPKRLMPEDVSRWTLLVGARVNGLRSWQAEWVQNTHLIVVDLATGAATTRRLFLSQKRQHTPEPSMSGLPPGEFDAATVRVGVGRYRPFESYTSGLPGPGRYAMSVVYFDWASNTVVAQVGEPASTGPPETTAQSTLGVRASPQVQTEPRSDGRLLRFTMPAMTTPGAPLIADVSIDVPVPESSVQIRRSATDQPIDRAETGLLPVTLLMFARDAVAPVRVDLMAPARLNGLPGPAARVQATFSFNVYSFAAAESLGGEYQAYLVVGSHLLGPRSVQVDQ